ncbi:MAG: hypothetical protein ACYC0V_05315 [Armatimonadota bacterium]
MTIHSHMLTATMILALTSSSQASSPDTLKVGKYPQLISTIYADFESLNGGNIEQLRIVDDKVYARSSTGFIVYVDDKWQIPERGEVFPSVAIEAPCLGLPEGAIITSSTKAPNGSVWLTTSRGAFKLESGTYIPVTVPKLYRFKQPLVAIDADIKIIASDNAGHIWLLTDSGACITDGADWWHPLNRRDGMPYEDLRCITFSPNGDIWGGTSEGAWRLRGGEWRYLWGRRWLPGNIVNDIVVDDHGAVWLATDKGVSRIEERQISLSDKAEHFEEITAKRHNRRGWVTSSVLKTPGHIKDGVVYEASDNDGLWTAMYAAAEAFRYAVTKSPEARKLCSKSMDALLNLTRLSGYPGYPARAIINKDEIVNGYDPNETVRINGEADKIWYSSPVDPNILCKGDTSSDELDGHYFAWYVYYDLVANDAEKEELRKVVSAVTDNLIKNDYTLIGHTGKKTRWGVFGPQYLNDDPSWHEERGLNSAELLCYLKVASHICGDKQYSDDYDELIEKHHYLLNVLEYRRDTPWYRINHSDDELAYLSYYPLMMLERNPQRKAILLKELSDTWDSIRHENSPFYSFIYGAITGSPCSVEDSVTTLRDWPWDMVQWETRNSHRHDVTFKTERGINFMDIDRVLPISERQAWRWNGNPWISDGGNGGLNEEDGAAWLLPYWMGRYHGIISE